MEGVKKNKSFIYARYMMRENLENVLLSGVVGYIVPRINNCSYTFNDMLVDSLWFFLGTNVYSSIKYLYNRKDIRDHYNRARY